MGGEKSSAESVWTHVCSSIHSPETDAKGVTSYKSNVKGVTSYEAEGGCLVYGVGGGPCVHTCMAAVHSLLTRAPTL